MFTKHRMAGHFARLDDSHIVAKVLLWRDLSWWRQQQQNWEVNGGKGGGVHSARFACWRWEQDFEISYGRSTRDEENAICRLVSHSTATTRLGSARATVLGLLEISKLFLLTAGFAHSRFPFCVPSCLSSQVCALGLAMF